MSILHLWYVQSTGWVPDARSTAVLGEVAEFSQFSQLYACSEVALHTAGALMLVHSAVGSMLLKVVALDGVAGAIEASGHPTQHISEACCSLACAERQVVKLAGVAGCGL